MEVSRNMLNISWVGWVSEDFISKTDIEASLNFNIICGQPKRLL